jgi:hypothetical protein
LCAAPLKFPVKWQWSFIFTSKYGKDVSAFLGLTNNPAEITFTFNKDVLTSFLILREKLRKAFLRNSFGF